MSFRTNHWRFPTSLSSFLERKNSKKTKITNIWPVFTLTQLIKDLANIVNPPTHKYIPTAQQQEQAILSAKNADDAKSIKSKKLPPILSSNWSIHDLTTHVIEEDNLKNLSFLIDTVQDLATYGATSEFFISAIRLVFLEQGGWG